MTKFTTNPTIIDISMTATDRHLSLPFYKLARFCNCLTVLNRSKFTKHSPKLQKKYILLAHFSIFGVTNYTE